VADTTRRQPRSWPAVDGVGKLPLRDRMGSRENGHGDQVGAAGARVALAPLRGDSARLPQSDPCRSDDVPTKARFRNEARARRVRRSAREPREGRPAHRLVDASSRNPDSGGNVELRELQDWFAPDELDPCPRCLQAAAIPIEHGKALLCFGCGYIRWPGGETSVRQLQRPPSASELPLLDSGR
jgi:hypothetical protein